MMPLKVSKGQVDQVMNAHRHGGDRISPLTAYRAARREQSGMTSASRRWCHHVRLPVEVTAPAMARRVVRVRSVLCGVSHLREAAEFCVSELVTNAVKHVQWPDDSSSRYVGLSVGVAGPYFLVTVSDPDPRLPEVGASVDWESFQWTSADGDPDTRIRRNEAPESGLGLFTVVQRVAEKSGEFGFEPSEDGHGKVIYIALPTAVYSWAGGQR